jgi:hypothetical protein
MEIESSVIAGEEAEDDRVHVDAYACVDADDVLARQTQELK